MNNNKMLWGPFCQNGHQFQSSRIKLFQKYHEGVFEAIHTYIDDDMGHYRVVPNRIIYFTAARDIFDFLKDEQFLGNPETQSANISPDHVERRIQLIKKDQRTFNSLSDEVKNAIADKNTLVYLDHSIEGWDNILFDRVCEIFNIPKERLVWVTSLYKPYNNPPFTEVKSIYSNFWEYHLQGFISRDENNKRMFEKQIQYSLDKKPRNKLCTSYMRRRRAARMVMAMLLKQNDLLKDMYWSLGTLVDGNRDIGGILNQLDSTVKTLEITHPGVLKQDTIDWAYSIDKNITCDNNTLDTNLASGFLTWEHIFDTKFMLVNETIPRHLSHDPKLRKPFLSEKIYKPFAAGQMFLVHGCAGTVAAIREKGYQTFDNIINHSYDNEQCPVNRANMVANEMVRLSQLDAHTWLKHLKNIVPELKFNYELFINCEGTISTMDQGW